MHRSRVFRPLSYVLGLLPIATALAAGAGVSGRVVDAGGKGVAGAVVFVQSPADSAAPTGGHPRAAMDQVNKTFVPGVLPVAVGTEVRFPNHDQIQHHVYSFSRTKSFELPLYKGQDAPPVLFDKPGVVKIGCNIHDWMSAVILVLPSRHYSVTDADGRFTLSDLPAGDYTLAAWHESSRTKLEETLRPIHVTRNGGEVSASTATDAATSGITFTLTLAPVRSRPPIHGTRRDP